MKICKNCGFVNLDTQRTCLKCKTILEHDEGHIHEVKLRKINLSAFLSPLNSFQYKIINILSPNIPKNLPFRFPFLAGLLSLIPGCGAIYNHQPKKAIFFIISYLIFLSIVIITLLKPYSNIIIALFICYVLFCYVDAFATSLLINGQIWTLRYTLAMFTYLLFMFGLILTLGQFFFRPVFLLVNIKQDVFEPYFKKNDRVYVDCLSYWFKSPKRGEIIYYNPKEFSFHYGLNMYVVHEKNSFERIIGVPGDKVQIINKKIFVNGNPVPEEFYPVGKLYPDNLEITVTEKKFLAIFSHIAKDEGMIFGIGAATMPAINISDYTKTCLVEKKEIHGRVLFRYNPPTRRCYFRGLN